MKKAYIISGAGGMTGLELIKQIAHNEQNATIFAFDNGFNCDLQKAENIFKSLKLDVNSKSWFERYATIFGNSFIELRLKSVIKEFVEQHDEEEIELIYVNCAAIVHTKHFYVPTDTFYINVLGMKAFMDFAISSKYFSNNIKVKFINCSTSEVYSMQSYKEGGVKEDDYLTIATAEHSLRTSYALGKLQTEMFLREYCNNYAMFGGCSVRFANVYSEDEPEPEHIIPYIIEGFKNPDIDPVDHKITIHLLENAKNTRRTFLHNYDSASAVYDLCQLPISQLCGEAYNVGTIEEYYISKLVDLIACDCGLEEVEYKIVYDRPARKADPERRLLNCDRIKNAAGWKPVVSLDMGIDRCVKTSYFGKHLEPLSNR